MAAKLLQGTIKQIEVVHRKCITTLDGYRRYARIVVWATTSRGKRIWICTVEGGLDPLSVEVKVAMSQEFFKGLVGEKIKFREGEFERENIFFAEKRSLPKKFLVSYSEIKKAMCKWVKTNLGDKLEELRKQKSTRAAATRRENVEADEANRKKRAAYYGLPEASSWQKIDKARELAEKKELKEWQAKEELRLSKELEERRKNALQISFKLGRNPKHGNEQWEGRHNGRLYILRREDAYESSEDKIPVEPVFDLVPGRITLVERI